MKYVCSCASMMINELCFGEARSVLGINIINFSYPSSFSLGGKTGYIRQWLMRCHKCWLSPRQGFFSLSNLNALPKLILSHTTNMSKVRIQVENTSYVQPESICFFPISSCFARKKKKSLNSLRFQEGVAILFFQNHWPDSVLEYCLNLNGRFKTSKYEIPKAWQYSF